MTTNSPTRPSAATPGVGIGLRFEFLEELSPLLGGQWHAGRAAIDFFEVAPENFMRRGGFVPAVLRQTCAQFPILSHGLSLSIGGTAPFDAAYLGMLRRFLDTFGVEEHSDHLCFSDANGVPLHDLFPLPLSRESLRHVASRVNEAQDRLGRRIHLENISYYYPIVGGEMPEPEFFTELVARTGCGVLLDVNNAFVNATNHGFDPFEFIERMPLEAVSTIHVAGHEMSAKYQILIDTHGAAVAPSVLSLLRFAVEKTGPVRIVLERDNNVPSLTELLEEAIVVRSAYRQGLNRHFSTSKADVPGERPR